jgi:hypothetical protein
LYYNLLYLNAQTKIASNDFPKAYKGYIGSTLASGADGAQWYRTVNADGTLADPPSGATDKIESQLANTSGTVLSGLVDGAFIKDLGTSLDFTGFVANSLTLLAVSGSSTNQTAGIKLNTKYIEDATSLSFTDIKSLAINSNKKLFVCDGVHIHKFDVDAVLTINPAINEVGRFLIKTIGGSSVDIYTKNKFGNPISVRIGSNDTVYVLDKKDGGYKIYDKDLNWISTHFTKTDFDTASGSVVDMDIDTLVDHVYILNENGVIFEYDNTGQLVSSHTLTDSLDVGEKYNKIRFSKINSDILYVLTTKNIYKRFKTKLAKSIGAFRLLDVDIGVNSTPQILTFIDTLPSTTDTTYEYVFVGGKRQFSDLQIGKIFKFDEKVSYQTIIYDSYKSYIYSLSSINVNGDEYNTSWVVNKSIYKLLYNHLLFRDNIHSKYTGTYDRVGRIQYAGVSYIKDADPNLFTYDTSLNNFVGLNEPVFAETINRPLSEIHKLQTSLLGMCKEKYTNKFPYPDQVVVVT